MIRQKIFLGWSLALIVFSLSNAALAAPLRILTTIPPLAFIAHDIAGDAVIVEILLPRGGSPHHYQLKPSDRIKIAQADLILWLGKDAESYLSATLSDAALRKKTLAVLDTPKVKSLLHMEPTLDIHFWLAPHIMNLFAQRLAEQLAQQNLAQAPLFRQRARQFNQQITLLAKQKNSLPIIEVADAFGYLHRALGIQPLLILNNHEDRTPSLQQRFQLQQQIQRYPNTCIIITPEITETIARQIINSTMPVILRLDPLGYDYLSNTHTFQYLDFFQQLAKNYLRCSH